MQDRNHFLSYTIYGTKRPETKRSKIAKMLIEEYQPQSAQDIQEALKDLLGDTME